MRKTNLLLVLLIVSAAFFCATCVASAISLDDRYVGNTVVDLEWTVYGESFSKYKLYREGALIHTEFNYSKRFYRDEGLSKGVTYNYKIEVYDASGGLVEYETNYHSVITGEVHGWITLDTTWTAASSPYNLTGYRIGVGKGAKLTIENEVTVNGNNNVQIQIYGDSGGTIAPLDTVTFNGVYVGLYHIDGYSIKNCVFNGTTASSPFTAGIFLNDCNNGIISNNVVENYRWSHGIWLLSKSSNNMLSNNTANNNKYGISLEDRSSCNTLSNNTANSNSNYGIELCQRSNDNILTGNTANYNDNDGIHLGGSCNNTFTSNTVNNNSDDGVFLDVSHKVSDNNTFTSNTLNNNGGYGICLKYSSNNMLTSNSANNNGRDGICLDGSYSYNNTLTGNSANNNRYNGIVLSSSDYNMLTSNSANSNRYTGIRLACSCNNTLSNNTANNNTARTSSSYGIELSRGSDDNILTGNTANYNDNDGIRLYASCNNTIMGNTANYNRYVGISLSSFGCIGHIDSSNNNTLTGNTANYNRYYGIYLKANNNNNNNNNIYDNYFNNTNNARDDGNNTWNIPKTPGTSIAGGPYLGGNYWSDYVGSDTDGDRLGDTLLPYNSSGRIINGGDYHPLLPTALIDLSIESKDVVAPDIVEVDTVPAYGEVQIVEIEATVHNNWSYDVHNVEVQLNIKFRDKTTLTLSQKKTIDKIAAGSSATVTFEWEVLKWVKDNLEDLWAEDQGGILKAPVNVEQKANFVYVEVAVDPENKIRESDETNNVAMAESKKTLLRVIPDVEITLIKPIQVIEDVPLIKDKPMMTRVWVKLWDGELFAEVHNVRVKVDFDDGNPPQELEMCLINREEGEKYVTYVVPEKQVSLFKFTMGNDREFNKFLFETGCDAFNFEYSEENNLRPRREGKLRINATLQNEDSFGDNDANSLSFDVIPCAETKKEYRILYIPLDSSLDSWGTGTYHKRSIAQHKQLMRRHAAFLEATYPVLEVWAYYGYTMQGYEDEDYPPEDPDTIVSFCAIHCPAAAAYTGSKYCKQGFDSTVYIVPQDALNCLGLPEAKGWAFPTGRGVFVDESTWKNQGLHTSAHEIGHTWTLSGGTRSEDYDSSTLPATKLAAEGWDVTGKATEAMTYPKAHGATIARARVNPVKEIGERSLNWKSHMGRPSAWLPWITEENYVILINQFRQNDPRVLLVGGEIHPNGTVDFWPFYSWEGGTDPLQQGNYSFECVAENGTVLGSFNFEPEQDEETGSGFFGFTLFYPDSTSKLVLRHSDSILAEKLISPNAPEISIDSVNDLGEGNYEITWNATDADGEELDFLFGIWRNDDEPWFHIGGELSQVSSNYTLKFSTSSTPGGDNCRVQVTATDGVNTVDAISEPFAVTTKPPSATVASPEDGTVFSQGDVIVFDGLGYDCDVGLLNGSTFVWTSSIDGEIGHGDDYFTLSNLSLGEHQITLTVTDSEGKTANASVNITIVKIVINEVYPYPNVMQDAKEEWIEIYNAGEHEVNLTGWKIVDRDGDLNYTIPANDSDWDGILEAGSYLVFHVGGTLDTPTEDIYGNFASEVLSDSNDSVSLLSANDTGIDFVRYGDCTDEPPTGTSWTGVNPDAPIQGQSLGRDKDSTGTDDGNDWENTGGVNADGPTPGEQNLREGQPPDITSFAPESPVNDTVCNWRTFNVTVNQTVNVSWYLNNVLLFTNESVREANCTLHAEVVGEHNVSAIASNENGTDMQTWVWNVTEGGKRGGPTITSFAPPSPVNDTVCNWRTFNVTVDQTVNVSWYLSDSILFTNESVTEADCTLHAEVAGEHNVSASASNINGTDTQTWIWDVTDALTPIPTPKPSYVGGAGRRITPTPSSTPTPSPTPTSLPTSIPTLPPLATPTPSPTPEVTPTPTPPPGKVPGFEAVFAIVGLLAVAYILLRRRSW